MTSTTQMTELLASIYDPSLAGIRPPGNKCSHRIAWVSERTRPSGSRARARFLPVMKAQLAEMSTSGIRMTGGDAIVAEKGEVVWGCRSPNSAPARRNQYRAAATVVASTG